MSFYISRDDWNTFQGDQWSQQALGKVGDQWANQATAGAPSMVADAEDRAQASAQAQAQRQTDQANAQAAAQAAQAGQDAQMAAAGAGVAQAARESQQTQAANQCASNQTSATSMAPSQAAQQATIDSSSPEAFIRSIAPWAKSVADQYGMPIGAIIGMAANETGFGRYSAGNNLFGIKGSGPAGAISSPTWEDYGAGPVNINANFRAYTDPGQSFKDFADLVTNAPRYAAAKGQQTVEGFVQALKDGGYMTDPAYVGKISSIAQRYAGTINDALQGAGQAVGQGAQQALQAPLQSAQDILQKVQPFLGNAYVWGGKSPQTGFDCSGLASWLTSGQPESTTSLYGKSSGIGAGDAQPGDLVFWNMGSNDPHMQHVAVYAGN